jgi:hypothetical protein
MSIFNDALSVSECTVVIKTCIPNRFIYISYFYVQTGSGVHPSSYTMGTGSSFPGVKRPEREADHSPPTSAEVKKMWIYTTTPLYALMA